MTGTSYEVFGDDGQIAFVVERPDGVTDGEFLRLRRKAVFYTADELASDLGVSGSTVRAWERGKWPNGLAAKVPEKAMDWAITASLEDGLLEDTEVIFKAIHRHWDCGPAFSELTHSRMIKWINVAREARKA